MTSSMSGDAEQQHEKSKAGPTDLREALELLAEKDDRIAILLDRIRQLEKALYGPRSAKRSEPIDPSSLDQLLHQGPVFALAQMP